MLGPGRFFFFRPSLSHTTGKTYRRGLDDGGGLDNLLLVHLGTRTVKVTDDGGHTGLVAHGGSKVDGLLGIILGEAVAKKSQRTNSQITNSFRKY